MTQQSTHKLQVGATTLELCPQVGGSITQFYTHCDGAKVDLMRATPVDEGSVLNTACFPLIPYSGRIADAEFSFAGEAVRESTLAMFAPNAIHGHGWLRSWSVTDRAQDQSRAHLTMRYQHAADGWPWSYDAVQTFELGEGELSVTLAITNQSETIMPAGLGLHPFFPMHDGAQIETATTGKWLSDDAVLPTQHIALDDDSPFNKTMIVNQQSLDNVFNRLVSARINPMARAASDAGNDCGFRFFNYLHAGGRRLFLCRTGNSPSRLTARTDAKKRQQRP